MTAARNPLRSPGPVLALGILAAAAGGGWWWSRRREGSLEMRTRDRLAPRQVALREASAADILIGTG